ncbi:hypothetical protein [[Clostridium] fimetarium]|uniref:Uncharacterized protein n=1 Tax=[Clostridium] fimetarium TaxID=99656 RepID=A0A1I0PVG9_9FIRM|nr:hypothetical protein [[Clostridium] fimetarium]SEW18346.1 hypothetical protein SAMN05421659_10634 [[Clostridium] fimetarium]
MVLAGVGDMKKYDSTKIPQGLISSESFIGTMSAASTQVENQAKGDFLSITMVPKPGTNISYGVVAAYAKESTSKNPIINVTTNYDGKTVSYNINVNEVDPNQASRLEMFALCAYADDVGTGDKSTFGTYQTLRTYQEMAKYNGYISSDSEGDTLEQFKNAKSNWVNMSQKVMDLLYKCNDLAQYNKGMSIMNLFSDYPKVV